MAQDALSTDKGPSWTSLSAKANESQNAFELDRPLSDREASQILPFDAPDSPFPEVRAVVPPIDDPSQPVGSLRMWTIGVIFTVVSAIIGGNFKGHPARRLSEAFLFA